MRLDTQAIMKFCSHCAAPVTLRIPEGDNRPRYVCDACHSIHYQNPNIVAGCIPEWEGQILLCQRGIEPRFGLWTLPAGFMENGETALEAAERETHEEARANVRIESLYTVFNLPHINQVYLLFRARLLNLDFGAGNESLDVQLYQEKDIPWDDLAFPVIKETLGLYFADRSTGGFRVHVGDIERLPGAPRRYRINMLNH